MLTIDNELCLLEKYKLTPTELYAVRVILIAREDKEYSYLQRFNALLNGGLRQVLFELQDKGIILKSYTIPDSGSPFIVEDVEFSKNFVKEFYKASLQMGEELFEAYPQFITVGGVMYNARRISKKFASLEDAFAKYAKDIKYDPEKHIEVLELIEWAKENQYNFTTLDDFIVDRTYLAIKAFKEGNGTNINLEAVQMI